MVMICFCRAASLVSFQSINRGLRFVHKIKAVKFPMNNPTVYFRLVSDSDRFQVFLPFKNELLNVQREFNFDRQLTETLDVFLGRMKCNLEKLISKKRKKKLKNETNADSFVATVELLKNGIPVSSSETCKNVFFDGQTSELTLKLNGINYKISINSPWVSDISLPTSMMAGFPIFPAKLKLLFSNKSNCLFFWFKAKQKCALDSIEWENLGSGFVYTPQVEDIGYYLKLHCTPSDGVSFGPSSEVISAGEVGAGPGHCLFDTRHIFTSSRLSGKEFRVCTYNILSDIYAETEEALNHLFPYCPRYALSYDYRKQLIIKEIIGYNADILCLQEVDSTAFENDLNVILPTLGYSGSYSQKGGTVREGVACFFLNDRFKCRNSHTIILAEELQKNDCLSDIWECVSKKESLKLRVIERHTALQVMILESKDNPGELLVIGNTHLYFHPDADHVRLLQGAIIVKYLSSIMTQTTSENPGCNVSLMIFGDFNSVPECGIYKLMTEKYVPKDYIDWRSNAEESVEDLELSQPWNLKSACGTPTYTNFTVGFADCLDYIFYQTDRLTVEKVIPLPSEKELRLHTAIPSVVCPSDHIALIADLKWTCS